MNYVLFNPHSGKGLGKEKAENYIKDCGAKSELIDMTKIGSYAEFCKGLTEEDCIYIFGGDGTLNRFINEIGDNAIGCRVYYYPTGSGNDFWADMETEGRDEPLCINKYIEELPSVFVNGKSYKFINGVGYGIDGYCCEIGDKLKAENKPVNYTSIAIKGLLFHYKPTDAVVTVDGVEHKFKKVWLTPTMFGNHYGGGMIPAPEQKRDSADKNLSVMIFAGSGKIRTLMIFPSIFKGEHVKHKKQVTVLSGREITVKFNRPTPLQIDGETVLGVTEYKAVSPAKVPQKV